MNYGKILRQNGWWVIDCEPQVRARLKRVFPRMPANRADGMCILSDTPENSRELAWFLVRFPMELTDVGQKRLRAQAAEHLRQEERLADLLAARRPPAQIELAVPPRAYQCEVPAFLGVRGGLLLADDVGLGKTISAICCMQPELLPAVVVCPAHLPRHWTGMLERFAPKLLVHRIRKGQPYDITKHRGTLFPERLPDVIVISYHMLRGWSAKLAPITRLAVFDECQQLRRTDSDIYRASRFLADAARQRLGLSATPIYNYGSEFYWVIDSLSPGVLGQRDEFVREWCIGGSSDKARIEDTEDFGSYLRREGIMLRRTRAEVGRELPELTKVVHEIDATTDVLKNLSGDAMHLARLVLAQNEAHRGQRMQASGMFDAMLRQATGVTKAKFVAEFVKLLADSGEKIVLFGWHREVYGIWLEHLKELNPVMYTGTESGLQKHNAVQAFVNGNAQVLIMSLRSGAGVDGLQGKAHIAVFGELDWSPGVHEQCAGRLHRDGQTDPVTAYFMTINDGADPVMVDVLGIKREQIEGVRNPGGALAQRVEDGEAHVKRLAREFLDRHGEAQRATVTHLTPPAPIPQPEAP